jgi:integrase
MSKITGSYVDPNRSKVTVGVLADQWLDAKLDLAPKTRDRYNGIMRAHIRPRWGKVRLSDVTHAEVQRWLARLDVAPATVRKVHRVLSMVLGYAVQGWAAGRQRRGWGEPAACTPGREEVSDNQQVAELAEAELREVLLPRFLLDDLARHVTGRAPGDLVFTGERGAVMRSQTFQRAALTKAADEIGIPGFHPLELRHTAASLAIASGADVKVVQQMLGHKSATMTLDLYGHLFGDRLDVVADAMDSARASALSGVYPACTTGEVIELRRDAK